MTGYDSKRQMAADKMQEPAQEPVAHVYLFDDDGRPLIAWDNAKGIKIGDKLYTPPQSAQEPVAWSARAADVQEVCTKIEKYGLMMGEADAGPYIAWMLKSLNALADAASPLPAQEPVGFMNAGHVYELQQKRITYGYVYPKKEIGASVAVYTTPLQRQWIWLSDADIAEVVDTTCQYTGSYEEFLIKKAERKIKELNT